LNILLVCAAGLSTSLVTNKMKAALSEAQKEWRIEAHPIAELSDFINDFDVVLLGPQVSHKFAAVQKEFESFNKPIAVISPMDYGLGNGKAINDFAIKIYEEHKK
jgi:PTS system cellobiose-specific IIB component